MTIERIVALAAPGESETLEFKATTGTRREAAMTVCAFLNQGGGQVLFGVTPGGVVAGQQVSERTVEELSAELPQIDPPAFPTVERVPVDGGREVVVVSTGQGASRPCAAGLPAPEIEDDGGAVTVRFRHSQLEPRPMPNDASGPEGRQQRILAMLDGVEDGLARREIRARLGPGVSERQVTRDLESLRERVLIASSGHGASARWKRVRNSA